MELPPIDLLNQIRQDLKNTESGSAYQTYGYSGETPDIIKENMQSTLRAFMSMIGAEEWKGK